MFALQSNITIGPFTNVKPHEVKVKKSIHDYCDYALIKVPATAYLVRAGAVETVSASTAQLFQEGMAVSIQLGYDGVFNNEFTGFVRRVNPATPCEIECEGYSYQLRIRTYTQTFKKTQLKTILQYLVQGTGITLDSQIPAFLIDVLAFSGWVGTQILEKIMELSNKTIRIFFTGNVLYAGLIYLNQDSSALTYNTAATVKYQLGWNVIKDNSLKLREAGNQNYTVVGNIMENNGTKNTYTAKNKQVTIATGGNLGETKVLHIKQIKDAPTAQGIVNAKHNEYSYDGYEGKITAFLLPYCRPGYTAAITDVKYPARSGNYFVEAVEVTYGHGAL